MSASHNAVSFDVCAVYEIHSILHRNHIYVALVSFATILKLSRPHFHTNGFYIALQGSSSCVNQDVVIY